VNSPDKLIIQAGNDNKILCLNLSLENPVSLRPVGQQNDVGKPPPLLPLSPPDQTAELKAVDIGRLQRNQGYINGRIIKKSQPLKVALGPDNRKPGLIQEAAGMVSQGGLGLNEQDGVQFAFRHGAAPLCF
jgi:hypothetical protein